MGPTAGRGRLTIRTELPDVDHERTSGLPHAVSRASTALRGVSRSAKEGRDVERAEEGLEAVQQSRRDLEAELERELAALAERFDPEALPIETVTLRPRRADVEVRSVALAWIPYRPAAGGREPAWR